jgi:hypothetical protein
MNLRELLQTELWSKETTRKVLRPAVWFLKRAAIVLGVLVVLIGVAYEIEIRWLTSGERKAGRVALAQIEELEKLQTGGNQGFEEVDARAKSSVAVAEQKAWTLRDGYIHQFLMGYLEQVEMNHEFAQHEAQAKQFAMQRNLPWHSSPASEANDRALKLQMYSFYRSGLHTLLD